MIRLRFRMCLMVAAAALMGSAANVLPISPRSNQSASRPVPARAVTRIQREVLHQIRLLPYYSVFDNIEFRVTGYRVELYGQVVRPTLRSDAEAVVKRVEGVERVVNNIEVLPLSIDDNHIRREEFRAIYGYPGLDRYAIQAVPPIHIIVKNGHVTLEGVVAREMDRNVAYVQANSVPGVFTVTNRLRVEGE